MGVALKRLAILGSTGSIGRQTLEVAQAFSDRVQVIALAAGQRHDLLLTQARQTGARFVASPGLDATALPPGCALLSMEDIASHHDVDLVMIATVGRVGLLPTLAALRAGKTVALANKEALVMAGAIITTAASEHGASLLPVDSEPSAIWQCLRGEDPRHVARLWLTASGGAFRDLSADELAAVTPQQALRHPTWQMGPKVTVDSATLMNKGLEAIEARWFFDVPLERIEIALHRESIVHSMVEFIDGSTKAQASRPDMRLPIQEALSYPERWPTPWPTAVPWRDIGCLRFGKPETEQFPCLALAIEAGRRGGTYPAALAAADEVAVARFLDGHIRFTDIARLVAAALEDHRGGSELSLDDILTADAEARRFAVAWEP